MVSLYVRVASECTERLCVSGYNYTSNTQWNIFSATEEAGVAAWEKLTGSKPDVDGYKSYGQDLVEQLISGIGWRVQYFNEGSETTTMVVTSPDKDGAKFLVQAPNKNEGVPKM